MIAGIFFPKAMTLQNESGVFILQNSDDLHSRRLVMEWSGDPGNKTWKPKTPEPPILGNLRSAVALGGCTHFQGRQVAVGRLAAQRHSPAQPPPAPSHKDPGLARRSEAQGGFQGTLWLFFSTIRAASVFRGASRAELCSQVSPGEAGRQERVASFMAISSLD